MSFNERSLRKEYLIDFYEKHLLLFGDRPEALRWTPEGQRLRYSIILDGLGPLDGKRVLDYGCGLGGFYGFLREKGINARYTGTDINPKLIETAKAKYPEADFSVFDAEEEEPGGAYDFVIVCGVFNNNIEGVGESAREVVRRLFKHTKKCLVFNALSAAYSIKTWELYYHDPAEFLSFAIAELTPFALLRHDYLPEDFTAFLYRRPGLGPY